MILALAVTGLAWAGEPTKVGTEITLGSDLRKIVRTSDEAWIAVLSGAGTLELVDPGTFTSETLSVCSDASALVAVEQSDGTNALWVGCPDGTLVRWDVDSSGNVSEVESGLDFVSGAVMALDSDGDYLYAVVDGTDGYEVDALDLASSAEAGSPWPVSLSYDDVVDTVMLGTVFTVIHSQDNLSRVDTSTGNISNPQENLSGRDWQDAVAYLTSSAYLADKSGAVVRFDISTNGYTIVLDNIADEIDAVGLDAASTPTFLLASSPTDTLVYGFSGAPGSLSSTFEGAGGITEFATTDGYAWGMTDSTLTVFTDRPWVEASEPSTTTATSGDVVTFTFTSDTSTSYRIRLNGGLDESGDELASGDVAAGETVSVSVTVDSSFAEGVNHLWVFAGTGTSVGHDAVTVTVDSPPPVFPLAESDVGWGNETVFVEAEGLTIADLDHYTVYLSSTPFTADAWPTGGPSFGDSPSDDPGSVGAPRTVTADPGDALSVTFYPLENGTTYYVAVRATDTNQNEGPMSTVQAITPQETYSASELRGDPGGYCGTRPGGATGIGAVALGALALLRRRRAAVALAAAGLLVSGSAAAKDPDPPHFNGQIRGGYATLADPYVQDVFGKWNIYLRADYGLTTRYFEFGVGTGLLQKKGYLIGADGSTSNEDDKLTIVPINVDARLRLDFFHEQILVPFGGAGGDYWMWKEKWWVADTSDDDRRSGGKLGWHWDAGAWLRLDPLDPKAASSIEATAGIDDSFLTFELRKTYMQHSAKLLDLSDTEFTLGLKCDF